LVVSIKGSITMRQNHDKYSTMIFGILTLITALAISAVAIYYSVAGLMAIFAAAALPIMIMGGTLEIAKLVTAVWLHKYWERATWWIKTYLVTAVVILMFITSMGIFGFLSKAHIEQTSASEESVARVETIVSEIARQESIVERANARIVQLESSDAGEDDNVQSQIDKEQVRIDLAFDRINPAIAQQNATIESARKSDSSRTKPYEDQLSSITAEVLRLETSAKEYESTISILTGDASGVEPLLAQIAGLEAEIIRVTNQLQSKERDQIRAGQAIIGVSSDGAFGGNTRRALVAWVAAQRDRITQIQGEVATVRKDATITLDAERTRLADVVKDIRTVQIPALKSRELTMLGKIDEVRQTESPVITTAREEIQRLRESAEAQVAQSQILIERLRSQLGQNDNTDQIDADIDIQQDRIKLASQELDMLSEEKIALEAEYRKLEAEVGPIKYIAEFVYGETADSNMLEEAVRWVIIIIIFVFDPLAVLLLLAAQYTFQFRREDLYDDNGERLRLEREEFERARAQRIVDNPRFTLDDPVPPTDKDSVEHTLEEQKEEIDDGGDNTGTSVENPDGEPTVGTGHNGRDTADGMAVAGEDNNRQIGPVKRNLGDIPDTANRMFYPEELEQSETQKKSIKSSDELRLTEEQINELDTHPSWQDAKQRWKDDHPTETLKDSKIKYLHGIIDKLPWEDYLLEPHLAEPKKENGYIQNQEQTEKSIWKNIGDK
jgi:hypothetical protein